MQLRRGPVNRAFYNRNGKVCGELPTWKMVLVINRKPRIKPGFGRILRPADVYLNGSCSDEDGYFIETKDLLPL